MMLRSIGLLLMVFASGWTAVAGEVSLDGHRFKLPDGFTIERIASPPLVDRPITVDFDEQGRLYVADAAGTNDKVEKQLAEKPHRILRLEDTDGDGKFDKRTVFADRMMFPEGTMWFDGSLYVSAPPSIWKLTDSDGDGVADQRTEWFQGKTLTGCANDLHGPYLGRDGWIYWCKGAFAKQTYQRQGKPDFVTRAAHIFRCRPDGSDVEPVMTGGMDNPVDVVFTPGGERIFTTTFLQHPGGGKRDGLIHAVYGGVYGKTHDVIEEHPRTGDVMPVLTHLGPAAPCGLAHYDSAVFGPAYQNNLFAALFNLHKITRHVLEPDGASFRCRDEDFLVSDNLDFHPTDVIEDADGSLVVVNTGGWYKLCCPTSQLHKPDVLGTIYRVRSANAPRITDPRGREIDWSGAAPAQLVRYLDDERPAVQRRATEALARRGRQVTTTVAGALAPPASARMRRNAVWTLTRIDDPLARERVRGALGDADETVCLPAIHSVSVLRDPEAVSSLIQTLGTRSPACRRAAAEALGRLGDRAAVPALLQAAASHVDRALEHSLTYALIEIGDASATRAGLEHASSRVRRAALVALDQMPNSKLDPRQVAPLLLSGDPVLKETASWLMGRHADWGDALADFLRQRLGATLIAADRSDLEQHLARFAKSASIQKLLAEEAGNPSRPTPTRQLLLGAMARAGLKELPAPWSKAVAMVLQSGDVSLLSAAIPAARAAPAAKAAVAELTSALADVGRNRSFPPALRLEALAALPDGLKSVEPALFDFLLAELPAENDVHRRSAAAAVLARAALSKEQLLALTHAFASIGPMEIDRLASAFERSGDEAVGRALLDSLKSSPGLSGLRTDTLKAVMAKYPPTVQAKAEEIHQRINADLASQRARLESLVQSLQSGDVRRGQAVFHSAKAACASCHAMGYLGGTVGPDLTRIGQIRTERDLLEAVVFPSASFVRSYEPVVVATTDGRVITGVLRTNSPDEVVLATGPNEDARIAREEVDEMRPGTVSVMPAGLEQQLTVQELADLVAFLKAAK